MENWIVLQPLNHQPTLFHSNMREAPEKNLQFVHQEPIANAAYHLPNCKADLEYRDVFEKLLGCDDAYCGLPTFCLYVFYSVSGVRLTLFAVFHRFITFLLS